jgi:hypothetical protein
MITTIISIDKYKKMTYAILENKVKANLKKELSK